MKKLVIVESPIDGKGLFADESIKKGQFIQYIEGKKVRKIAINKIDGQKEMRNWYGISNSIWIDPEDTKFAYLNHSCEPNTAISGTKSLKALRDIEKGEEITIDYSITDPDPLWEMECKCNTKTCRKIIRSIDYLPKKVFGNHFPNVPRYFQKRYIRNYIKNDIK